MTMACISHQSRRAFSTRYGGDQESMLSPCARRPGQVRTAGPESPSNLHVQVNQLNRKLAPYGVAVRGSRFYGYKEVKL
jgi:hypothetical protein